MENKNDADILLDLIQFNKKKYKIITQMAELEAKGITTGKTYNDLVKSYNIVYWFINKELTKYSIEKKNELLEKLIDINPNIGGYIPLMDVISNSENKLPLQKTITDLGATFMTLYQGEDSNKSARNTLMNILGIDTEEIVEENPEAINSYMTNDFVNMLLSVIMEDIKLIDNETVKKALLNLKYNLIYISDNLETRAINTSFLLSEKPSLIDELTINTANITKEAYLRKSDIVFSRLLENQILEAVNKVYKEELKTLHYLDHILIRTYANLITDRELCSYLVMEPTDKMLPNIKAATIIINNDLTKGANVDITNRKIMRI